MCSINGVFNTQPLDAPGPAFRYQLAKLLKASEQRGRDGFGCFFQLEGSSITGYGKWLPKNGGEFHESVDWYMGKIQDVGAFRCLISNHRAEPTTEYVPHKSEDDQQPYERHGVWVVHNGTIANDKEILKRAEVTDPPTKVDSYALAVEASMYGTRDLLHRVKGSIASLIWDGEELVAVRNYSPLNIVWCPLDRCYVFSSLPELPDFFPGCQVIDFPPYSRASDFRTHGTCRVETEVRPNQGRGLVICSGGLDSVTVATLARRECPEMMLLHFKYGCQAEIREMQAVINVGRELGVGVKFVDMDWLKRLGGSPLTDGGPIAGGEAGAEFAHEWVPARNTAMIGIAAAYADRYDLGKIYLGLNLEEAGAYPDNTIEFYQQFSKVLSVGTQARPQIVNPLATLTKKEIVKKAYEIGAPIHLAWSCYEGGEFHCGRCGPCHMRRTAHRMLGIPDTVRYNAE